MPVGVFFWVIWLIAVIGWIWGLWPSGPRGWAPGVLVLVLIAILGWHTFGAVVK